MPLRAVQTRTQQLSKIRAGLVDVNPGIQKLAAELLMLRLFDLFMDFLDGTAVRLVCGADYLDGSSPLLLQAPAPSTTTARRQMETLGRSKAISLTWSQARSVQRNVRYLVDPTDDFRITIRNHSSSLEEMRRVRNRIAHNNSGTRSLHLDVVEARYGARLKGITPGTLLLSRRLKRPLIDEYIGSTDVLAKTLVKG